MTAETNEIADMTAIEMIRHFESGELSPVEAATAALERIETYNDTVNAYCLVDENTTLKAARAAEERRRRGQATGLADGVPVAIKDVFLTRGWPTLRGSKLIDAERDGPWEIDAPAVAALIRHGAVPLGKTTTPELGWKAVTDSPLCGVTTNPWDPSLTAGGSSGGSAAAVPLGMGPLSLGTDAGGSIRIPASFCGLFGHKPTQGRAPMWPISPFGQLAHVGPMTWTVADAALMMDILCEPDPRDATLPRPDVSYRAEIEKGVKGLKIAFSPALGFIEVEEEIAALIEEVLPAFEEAGATVERQDPGFEDPLESFHVLFYGGAANAIREKSAAQRKEMDADLVAVSEWAEGLGLLDYLGAANVKAQLTETMNLFHQDWDLLVTPTMPIPPFEGGRLVPEGWKSPYWPSWTPFTYPFNMTGQPACSVPCGFDSNGLPVGLHIIGARHRDDLVLRAAHAFQQARPFTGKRPRPENRS